MIKSSINHNYSVVIHLFILQNVSHDSPWRPLTWSTVKTEYYIKEPKNDLSMPTITGAPAT